MSKSTVTYKERRKGEDLKPTANKVKTIRRAMWTSKHKIP